MPRCYPPVWRGTVAITSNNKELKTKNDIAMERNYPVERLCHQCGEVTVIYVREEDYNKRVKGRSPAQNCFPYLTMPERETIISGMCPECQKKLFPLNYDKNGNWVGYHDIPF